MATAPRFTVIPLEEVPIDDARMSSDPGQQIVLIVDDEGVVADTLSLILRRAGYITLSAYDARSALELASAFPPNLLITDVAMPEMDGIDLAIALVNILPNCKVLLFSGHATAADLLEARAAGYNFPLLAKPVHPSEMVRQVNACLRTPDLTATVQ